MEIDVHEYGAPDEENGTVFCACVDEVPCAEKTGSKQPCPAGRLCPEGQRECGWQGRGLVILSASMAAVTIFAAGCSVRCRHELEMERLRLQMQLSSAEQAVQEAQRRADEAFSALIAAAQCSEMERD